MAHHRRKHQYTFKQFTKDVSKPFAKVEKDTVGLYNHGISAFENIGKSLGGSLSLPLLIIGGGLIVYVVVTTKK
jgi:hypothetical protein